jgi:hypothetical protein
MAALQIQNRLVHACLDRGRDALLRAKMPEKCEESPPASLTAQRIQSLACSVPRARPL